MSMIDYAPYSIGEIVTVRTSCGSVKNFNV
jgi:hypothetical protein